MKLKENNGNGFFKEHFTVGGAITLLTAVATLFAVVGAVFVFADDMGETQKEVTLMKTHISVNTKHAEKTDIHHTGKDLTESFVTKPIFEAYQASQKDLDEQFQTQLFIQLKRIEGKLK